MSLPADEETKLARNAAHVALDNLGWHKAKAYAWIQKVMGLSKEQAHIGHMDREACFKLIELINKELEDVQRESSGLDL